MDEKIIEQAYAMATDAYAALGVDTNRAIHAVEDVPISINCWQGDDVGGFETAGAELSGGGIQVTGGYPGKARTIDELRRDISTALSLIPGRHRLNLHASYLDNRGVFVERNEVTPAHFESWIDWARAQKIALDFNPTFFSHPKAADGFTLSHPDKGIRDFWIEHGIACREIGAAMGQALGSPAVTNVWIPDGYKDVPVDRISPRQRLIESLDRVFADQSLSEHNFDAVESKLFGIGVESYTVGSHEFYLGYAVSRQKLLCLDAGHFHPTEVISDKISSVLQLVPGLLLHVSRPVRWDSDHVVVLSDELYAIAQELVRSNQLDRMHVGLDFFDASINRVAAWVIGTRNMIKALLFAFLEPTKDLVAMEREMNFTGRLALLEELKTLPFGAVWDYYCMSKGVPVGVAWIKEIQAYERDVLSRR